MDKDQLIAMATRVFPKPKKAAEEVAAASASVAAGSADEVPGLESLKAPAPMTEGPGAAEEAEMFGLPRTELLDERLRAGTAALEKVSKGKTNLTPSEQLGLEAIVHLFGRPALLVQDGDFGTPPDEWKQLEDRREILKTVFQSVGRVDLDGHHTYQWCGTAFVVGDGVLMTNRHVAQIFAEQRGKDWKFVSGVKARIDYKEEYQRDLSSEFKIEKVLGVHPTYDLALLAVAKKSGKKTSPPSLTVSAKAPKTTKDGEVAVVGYPAFDTRNGRNEQIDIFKNIFDVKRLQPGKSTGLKQSPQILGHDCSTLGGNSGSCVIDLETGNVIALHFGGQYLKGNVSVPLWKLANDPLLKKHKVNFG
jgi:V8-like Glu-specific endopeptidase